MGHGRGRGRGRGRCAAGNFAVEATPLLPEPTLGETVPKPASEGAVPDPALGKSKGYPRRRPAKKAKARKDQCKETTTTTTTTTTTPK